MYIRAACDLKTSLSWAIQHYTIAKGKAGSNTKRKLDTCLRQVSVGDRISECGLLQNNLSCRKQPPIAY